MTDPNLNAFTAALEIFEMTPHVPHTYQLLFLWQVGELTLTDEELTLAIERKNFG